MFFYSHRLCCEVAMLHDTLSCLCKPQGKHASSHADTNGSWRCLLEKRCPKDTIGVSRYGPFWRRCGYSNETIFCMRCRHDPASRLTNTEYQWTCIRCRANSSACQMTYSVESNRQSRLEMGARIAVALKESGMNLLSIKDDVTRWLIWLADRMVGNKMYEFGERLMKASSHMGEIRIPPHMAEELRKGGKMRQIYVNIERSYSSITNEVEEYFLLGKDFGNVAYKENM